MITTGLSLGPVAWLLRLLLFILGSWYGTIPKGAHVHVCESIWKVTLLRMKLRLVSNVYARWQAIAGRTVLKEMRFVIGNQKHFKL